MKKGSLPNFWVVPSLSRPNVHFIFRDTGVEVEVMIENNETNPSQPMSYVEDDYFNENILKKKRTG